MKNPINQKFLNRILFILTLALVYSCSPRNDTREQANKLYSQGLELTEKGGVPNFLEAAALFKKSVEIDSTFANGYAAYSITYANLGGIYNYLSPEKVWPEAIPAANKAVALDPKLAWGYVAKACVEQFSTWDWTEMGKYLKKAVDLEPENINLLIRYAGYLATMNRRDEAKTFEDKAMKLAPDSPAVINYLRSKMIFAGEFDKVKPLIKKEIEANPKNPYLYWRMAILCTNEGKPEEALENLSTQIPMMNGDIVDEVALCGYNLGRIGKTGEALAQLKKLDELAEKGMYVSPAVRAWIYCGLNNRDEAMACLEKGFSEHAFRMGLDLVSYPFIFEPLADDPRYGELLKKMNL